MTDASAVKIIALLKRRPGMAFDDFVAHYENNHAPLVVSRKGPWLKDYRRNFVLPGSAMSTMDGLLPDCDVVTEATFATAADFDAYLRAGEDPEYRRLVVEDEMRFIDRGAIRFFRVSERASDLPDHRP